jgi:hypothetical protein
VTRAPLFRLLAAAAAALALAAPARAQQDERSYAVPGRGKVTMSVPAAWFDEPRTGPTGIPTVRFFDRIENPKTFDMSVTLVWTPPGASPYASPGPLRTLVEQAAQDVAPGAAEKQLPVLEFAMENGSGFLFRATSKNAQPGEPAYLTRGALSSGDLMITFTILTAERGDPAVAQAIKMLQSARRAPGAP